MAATAKHLRSLPPEPEIRHRLEPEDLTPIVPSYPGGPNQVPAGLYTWETLDRYKLVSPLGHGGMAEVFLAAQEVDAFVHRPVVVKRLHAHLAADPNIVQMFLDEAKLLCLLKHPHVVQTYEAGIIDGHCCIAMEYLEGQTLAAVLKRAHERSLMTPELAIEVVVSVLSGLHHAHEARDEEGRPLSIVHRDVSPHNVFITNDGDVKLLDFGVAKARTQESRTKTGIVKGKPGYIAPEQARAENVDRRADVWSAGILLWEALTGARLFKADTEAASILLTLTGKVDPPSLHRPEIPAALDSIVARALERNVARRYQTAFDMRMDLEAVSRWSSRAANAMAALMQTLFADEILEQRRLVSLLMARSDCTPPSFRTPAPPESVSREVRKPTESERPISVPPPLPPASKNRAGGLAAPRNRIRLLWLFALTVVLSFVAQAALRSTRSADDDVVKAGNAPSPVTAPPERSPAPPVPTATPARTAAPPSVTAAVVEAANPVHTRAAATATAMAAPVATAATTPAAPAARPTAPTTMPVQARLVAPERPAATTPVEPTAPAASDTAPVAAFGSLTIDSTPWSFVSEAGRSLGQTPLVGLKLSAGIHTFTLKNPELGLETTYTVTIEAGKTQTRRIGLE